MSRPNQTHLPHWCTGPTYICHKLACVQIPYKLSADEKRAAFNQELLSSCAGAAWLHAFESLREQCILPDGTAARASGLYNMLPTVADVKMLQVPIPGKSPVVF